MGEKKKKKFSLQPALKVLQNGGWELRLLELSGLKSCCQALWGGWASEQPRHPCVKMGWGIEEWFQQPLQLEIRHPGVSGCPPWPPFSWTKHTRLASSSFLLLLGHRPLLALAHGLELAYLKSTRKDGHIQYVLGEWGVSWQTSRGLQNGIKNLKSTNRLKIWCSQKTSVEGKKSKDERKQRAHCHLKQGRQNKLLWRIFREGRMSKHRDVRKTWLKDQVKWTRFVGESIPHASTGHPAWGWEMGETVGSVLHRGIRGSQWAPVPGPLPGDCPPPPSCLM